MPIVPDGYGGDKSGDFSYAGADYKLGKHIRLSYFYGELENFYRQNFVGIQHDLPLGAGVLTSDLRYFNSVDSGSAYSGKIDNDMLSGSLSYAVVGHTLRLSLGIFPVAATATGSISPTISPFGRSCSSPKKQRWTCGQGLLRSAL